MMGAGRVRVIALTLVAAGAVLAAGAPGDLDTDFGTGGVASVNVPFSAGGYSTVYRDGVRQSGGRIVLVGSQSGSQRAWHATALDSTGAADSTFGSGGTATLFSNAVNGQMHDAGVDGEDRIHLCGFLSFQVVQGKKTTTITGLAVARLTASGALDTSFGNGGLVHDALGDMASLASPRALWVAIQADGKVVVAGDVVKVKKGSTSNTACLLVRYLANGQRDSTFGTGGVLVDDLSSAPDAASAGLAVDGSGRLLVGAYSATYGDVLSRYQASGALDTSFGTAGRVFPDFSMRCVTVDSQNRVLACGGELGQGDVARYTTSGASDSAFATGGLLVDGGVDFFFEVAVEAGDDLLLSGLRDAGVRSITRVLADGTPDTGFGTSGHAEGPVTSTTGGHCPVLLGPGTVAFSMGAPSGTNGSPWYVTRFVR
jgi:uncharacterized delta-60 repeat protein